MENGPVHVARRSCRACGGDRLHRFLTLGPTPLANSFLRSTDEFAAERRFPLDVYLCGDCSLVQLLDVIDPSVLFRDYIYVSGTSDTILVHHREYAKTLVDRLGLGRSDLVVEVASNDGCLLKSLREHGVRTLGIEPATAIAEQARADGIDTLDRFFDGTIARSVRADRGPARVVVANNVLAHVDDPLDFLAGCRELVEPDGWVVIEVPYLKDLVARLEYDTIYHEHLCYFSVTTLLGVFEASGLAVAEVTWVPIHGGSLRVYAAPIERLGAHAPQVVKRAEEERREGLCDLPLYERFARAVEENRRSLLDLLQRLRREGATVAAYGAPAKGSTLLNYCSIGVDLVPYTIDKNPRKIGLYTPGMHLPVLEVSALLERQPAYVLILAWNFADEIMKQQADYRRRGGRFILPIPEPRVV